MGLFRKEGECYGIRPDCSRSSGGRPECKSNESEERNEEPMPCGTGTDSLSPPFIPCTKYCNSFRCVPRCKLF